MVPSLKRITAAAPAFWALTTFCPKSQVPRWSSAILPAIPPAGKSLASQPDEDALALVVGSVKSIETIAALLTAPLPENSIVSKFVPSIQPPDGAGVLESVDGAS